MQIVLHLILSAETLLNNLKIIFGSCAQNEIAFKCFILDKRWTHIFTEKASAFSKGRNPRETNDQSDYALHLSFGEFKVENGGEFKRDTRQWSSFCCKTKVRMTLAVKALLSMFFIRLSINSFEYEARLNLLRPDNFFIQSATFVIWKISSSNKDKYEVTYC